MTIKFDTAQTTLGAGVGAGGSFNVNYPAGRSADDYLGGTDHMIVSHSTRTLFAKSLDFAILFGAGNMTITMISGQALSAGAVLYLNLDRSGEDAAEDPASTTRMSLMSTVRMVFGAVTTAVATAVSASQGLNAGVDGLINGTLAVANVATFDVPRNVVAAWTGAAVLTITGTDEYGNVMVEASASGVAFTGKKAFKTITKVRVSANVTALTVGNGVVLGLPVFLTDVTDVLREAVNGAATAAGVFVPGDNTLATSITGDVRGTWAPASVPNSALVFEITAALRSISYRGRAQAIA